MGCSDPLFWQSAVRYPLHVSNVKFVDVDFRDLMIKKRSVVQGTGELLSHLTNVELDVGNCLLRSDQYLQVGCDLRDVPYLQQTLEESVDLHNSAILFVAEVSITYMDVDASDALIAWAATIPNTRFGLLEQIIPDGETHPFARTMLAHFRKFQTPLNAVKAYSSQAAQQVRFQNLGWVGVSARNLWELWGSLDFLQPAERNALDAIEPFDEYEEFALFGCHYVLLVAENAASSNGRMTSPQSIKTPATKHASVYESENIHFHASFARYPKAKGYKRFAAALSIRSPDPTYDMIGNFAGMELNSRSNAIDVYSLASLGAQSYYAVTSSSGPQGRMCHTITDLGDTGALLVGGRTSPDTALADCWLYNRWLNIFERVDNLPAPRFRHFAVGVGEGCVLVGGGKTDSQTFAEDYSLWSRRRGWIQCTVTAEERPCPTFGAIGIALPMNSPAGIIAGGISKEDVLKQAIWRWSISGITGKVRSSPCIRQRVEHCLED